MITQNYLIGGRLGDFIHSLVIPKYLYEKHGFKANIYIAEIGDTFSNGLLNTFTELSPLINSQTYVNDFDLYDNQHIDMRLCDFRNSPYIYTTDWNNIFFKTFLNQDAPTNYSWLEPTQKLEEKDIIYVNRSPRRAMSYATSMQYEKIFDLSQLQYKFICSDISQYNKFEYKDFMDVEVCPTIEELVNTISSGAGFIGNQSTPFAIASALNISRSVELLNSIDNIHYKDNNKKVHYFQGD